MTDHKAGKVRRLLATAAAVVGCAAAVSLAVTPAASAAGLDPTTVVQADGCSGCGGGGGGGGSW